MWKWWRRPQLSRPQLIELKHQLAAEIRALGAEIERRRTRGASVDDLEQKLAALRHQHHQTRLRIDRTS